MKDDPNLSLGDAEIEQRMSAAVRRALSTPPQPHTKAKSNKSVPIKVRASKKRATKGKPETSA